MLKRGFRSILTTWFAGLLVLLPLALTLALLGWVLGLLNRFVGPGSFVGKGFATLGEPFVDGETFAYLFGTLLLVIAIYLLGLAVQAGLKRPLARLLDAAFRRIPVVGKLYSFADKLVGLMDRRPQTDIAAMSAVWCFFGGDGVAVLALAPSADAIEIEGRSYFAVLIPSAPVPIGGGLLYVPASWVRPANIGFDKLTEVYVSMGIAPPRAST